MARQLVDLFDARKQPVKWAFVGLALSGIFLWGVRGVVQKLIQFGVPVDADPSSLAGMFMQPAFGLDRLAYSAFYWALFAVIAFGAARLARSDLVWAGLAALGTTLLPLVTSGMRALVTGQEWGWSALDRVLSLPGEALFWATLVVIYRLTRRVGVTFVLGLPAAGLVQSAWGEVSKVIQSWGEEFYFFGDDFSSIYFALSSYALFVPGLMLWLGHRWDLRSAPSGEAPAPGPMPRQLLVGGIGTTFLLNMAVGTVLFGYILVENVDLALAGLAVLLLLLLPAAVFWLLTVHRWWKAVPCEGARTTPGRAVGFLFIPFFNLYWVFQAVAGFPTDWNRARGAVPGDIHFLPRWPFVLATMLVVVGAIPLSALRFLADEHGPLAHACFNLIAIGGALVGFLPVLLASMACDAVNAAARADRVPV